MQEGKLLEVLRVLNKPQLQYCAKLLPVLLADKNNGISALFLHLKSFAPRFRSPQLEKTIVSKHLKISIKKLAYHSSGLLQAIEQCIIIGQVQEKPIVGSLCLMDYYQTVGLEKHYRSAARRVKKSLSDYPYQDATYWQYESQFQEKESRAKAKYERNFRPELQAAADALDYAYLSKKLPYLLEMTSAGQVLDIPYELRLAEAVKFWARQLPFQKSAIIHLYASILQLVEEPDEQTHFQSIREHLRNQEISIPPEILNNFYTYLLNYCTQKIRKQNDPIYYEYYLDLNSYLIEKGMLLEAGFLPPWRYSNLITVGLRTQRINWTKDFLEQYRGHLPPDLQENIYHYNLAHCKYYEKEHDTAQRLLNQLDLSDPLLAIVAKNLLVKIYWETGATELLLSFLEAYRVYIYRQPLAKPKLKAQVKAFITLVRRMAKTPDYARGEFQKLADNLAPATEILERDWLAQQLTSCG